MPVEGPYDSGQMADFSFRSYTLFLETCSTPTNPLPTSHPSFEIKTPLSSTTSPPNSAISLCFSMKLARNPWRPIRLPPLLSSLSKMRRQPVSLSEFWTTTLNDHWRATRLPHPIGRTSSGPGSGKACTAQGSSGVGSSSSVFGPSPLSGCVFQLVLSIFADLG